MSERLKPLVAIRVDQSERCVRNRRAQAPRPYGHVLYNNWDMRCRSNCLICELCIVNHFT